MTQNTATVAAALNDTEARSAETLRQRTAQQQWDSAQADRAEVARLRAEVAAWMASRS